MIKEQAGQDSPLPGEPERGWTSSDSLGKDQRNEQMDGQVTQETTQQFCGLDDVPQILESCCKKKSDLV